MKKKCYGIYGFSVCLGGSVDRRDEQILLKNKPFKPAVLYQVADLFGDKIPDRKVGEAKGREHQV